MSAPPYPPKSWLADCSPYITYGSWLAHNTSHKDWPWLAPEKNQLLVSIMILLRQRQILAKRIGLQLTVFISHLFPLAGFYIISMAVQHFRSHTPIVFAIKVENTRSFICLFFSKLSGTKTTRMLQQVICRIPFRFQAISKNKVMGYSMGFKSPIKNP